MRHRSFRRLVIALVALLALSAGCQSPSGTGPVTGTGQTATSAESTEAESSNRSDEMGTNGSSDDAGTSARFFETHEQTLRDAENVTVELSATTRYPESDLVGRSTDASYRFDFESGRAHRTTTQTRNGIAGPAQTSYTYRNETGSLFTKYDRLSATQFDSNATISPLLSNESQLVYRGEKTVDGVNGSVYTLDSYGGLESGWYANPDNVIAFDITYVVDEAGYVAYQRVNMTREWDGETVVTRDRRWFESVGSTTVPRPNWADEPVGNRTVTAPSPVSGR